MPAGSVAWSHDGSYIATRCDSMPTAVWVWETSRLELASLLLQARPVRSAQWCPASNRLVVSTGNASSWCWKQTGREMEGRGKAKQTPLGSNRCLDCQLFWGWVSLLSLWAFPPPLHRRLQAVPLDP